VNATRNDWVNRPGMGFVWWCLPLGVGIASNLPGLSARATALVWMTSFIWMETLLGLHSLNNIVGVTLTVALLSFVPEMLWRKYL
jgi:hypothetical protein